MFPAYGDNRSEAVAAPSYTAAARKAPAIKTLSPVALVPVFPGTNCEYDSARALESAGIRPEVFVIRNTTPDGIRQSAAAFAGLLKTANILFLPGGFSGGDEPDGSGKFITAFLRSPAVREGVESLLGAHDGLILGICNGFQALVKLGLVPFGEIREPRADSPTLARNAIGRHQSRLVYTRVASDLSPWLSRCRVGEVHAAPVSHGEGRFVCPAPLLERLVQNGQIATQYTDTDGVPSMDIRDNPNGSVLAIEGVTSPDGRVFGKMAHSERIAPGLYKNAHIPALCDLFGGAADYFKL